jgi:hypothetical protein
LFGDLLVGLADLGQQFVDLVAGGLPFAGDVLAEEALVEDVLHVFWCDAGQLAHFEVAQQLGTPLDCRLVFLLQNVPQQHFWNLSHVFFLKPKPRHQQRQNPKMLRRDMFGLYVLEQLMNVQMLLTGLRVVTNTQNHGVELVEIVGVLSFAKEQGVQGKQVLLVLVD